MSDDALVLEAIQSDDGRVRALAEKVLDLERRLLVVSTFHLAPLNAIYEAAWQHVRCLDDESFAALADVVAERTCDVLSRENAAIEAGNTVIEVGKHTGLTIAQVVARPRGEEWLAWLIKNPDHPQHRAGRIYARAIFPEFYAPAVGEVPL